MLVAVIPPDSPQHSKQLMAPRHIEAGQGSAKAAAQSGLRGSCMCLWSFETSNRPPQDPGGWWPMPRVCCEVWGRDLGW